MSLPNLTFVSPDLSDNSLGRTYALWLLARECGFSTRTVSPRGQTLWAPLQGTEFADECRVLSPRNRKAALREIARESDLLIAVKPLKNSLGLALRAHEVSQTPLLTDIDDPDLESRRRRSLVKKLPWIIKDPHLYRVVRKRENVRGLGPILVSNPVLREWYGGALVPHVRPDIGFGSAHTSDSPTVAFIGTPRVHKGLDVLRRAVSQLSGEGFRLVVSADAPPDAQPHEHWIGSTSLAEGLEEVAQSDIVALPSLKGPHSIGQLPAKLIDAMMLGRAIVASDIAPMPWALAGAGEIVVPGNIDSLVSALLKFKDPELRTSTGQAARRRALSNFTPSSVHRVFRDAVLDAVNSR